MKIITINKIDVEIKGDFIVFLAVVLGINFFSKNTNHWWHYIVPYVFVLFHEFGHAIVAKRLGIPVSTITLHALGGTANIEVEPKKSSHEFLIAIAGPLVNVLFMIILYPFVEEASFIDYCFMVNILICLFNMLPTYPMDGGRVVRSILGLIYSYERSVMYACAVSMFFCVTLGIASIYYTYYLQTIIFAIFGLYAFITYKRMRSGLSILSLG